MCVTTQNETKMMYEGPPCQTCCGFPVAQDRKHTCAKCYSIYVDGMRLGRGTPPARKESHDTSTFIGRSKS
jgi:hypothetical protein